jgi:hypothetical protein
MALSVTEYVTEPNFSVKTQAKDVGRKPLELGDALDGFKFMELTRTLGREYLGVQVTDLIHAKDADAMLRDLGIVREFSSIDCGQV